MQGNCYIFFKKNIKCRVALTTLCDFAPLALRAIGIGVWTRRATSIPPPQPDMENHAQGIVKLYSYLIYSGLSHIYISYF